MPLWEIVSPRGRVFSPFGRVFSPFGRAFSPLKNGLGSNISEETLVCPKRSFLWKTYLLGKRQKLSPLWKRQVYIYIFILYIYYIIYIIYIYIHLIIYTDTHICAYSQYIMSFLWFNKGKKTPGRSSIRQVAPRPHFGPFFGRKHVWMLGQL